MSRGRAKRRGAAGPLALLVSSGLLACSDGPSGPDPTAVADIEISPERDTLTWLGQTLPLDAQPLGADGGPVDGVDLSWSSTDTLVVAVDEIGVVTAVSDGTATVRASGGGSFGTARITVSQAPFALSREGGDEQQAPVGVELPEPVVVRVTDEGGAPVSGASVDWSVESGGGEVTNVEETDEAGVAAARWRLGSEEGAQELVAAVEGVPAVVFSAVAGPEVVGAVEISPEADTLEWIGETVQLSAEVIGTAGGAVPDEDVSWASDAPLVVGVDSAGVATARSDGAAVITASTSGVEDTVRIVVRQRPDAAEPLSGDLQSADAGSELPDPLRVRVTDPGGTGVPGATLSWTVTSGGGSLVEPAPSTDAEGVGEARWILGDSVGTQTVEVSVAGVEPLSFTAAAESEGDGGSLVVESIAPDPLVEGGTGTIVGTGFGGSADEYDLTVAGAPAEVISASETTLEFTVPSFRCAPAREVEISLTHPDAGSTSATHIVHPPRIDSLDAGFYFHFTDPADFCLYLGPEEESRVYLLGVQSTSESPSSVTPSALFSSTGLPDRVPASPSGMPIGVSGTVAGVDAAASRELLRAGEGATAVRVPGGGGVPGRRLGEIPDEIRDHRRGEAEIRRYERELIRELGGLDEIRRRASRAALTSDAPSASPPAEGDTVEVRVPETCTVYREVSAVVRKVGEHGVWLEDVDNPVDLDPSDFSEFSDLFDQEIFAVDEAYFGSPTDLDDNGRVSVLVTKEVNRIGVQGFVFSVDLFPRSTCPSSDEGEIFYGFAPDPAGEHGREYTAVDVRDRYPILVAHEVAHIAQLSRRIHVNQAPGFPPSWVLEGQATLAEEVVGFSILDLAAGNNYGSAERSAGSPWFDAPFIDLARYFGFVSETSRISVAPHECSWLGRPSEGNASPCANPARLPYGVPALFFRWLLDHYGGAFSDGQQAMMRQMVDHSQVGFPMIESVIGEEIDRLLALWAMSLYVDDAWLTGGAATLPSWDLADIFSGFIETARLRPIPLVQLDDEIREVDVAAGSAAYFLLESESSPYLALGASMASGSDLPDHMRYWVLRLR